MQAMWWMLVGLVTGAALAASAIGVVTARRISATDAGRRPGPRSDPVAGIATTEAEALRSALDTAHDAYVAIDPDGAIVEWNRQAEATFGWNRDEALGRGMAELILPPRYRAAHERGMRRYARTGEPVVIGQRIELSALHRDGREFPIEITIWTTLVQGQRCFHAFLHDISARNRMLERLTAQTAAAEALVSSPSMDIAIPKVLATICTALRWKAAAMWVLEKNGTAHLRCMDFWHPADAQLTRFAEASRSMRFGPGIGLPGRVLASGRAAWIEDVGKDGNFPRADMAVENGLHAAFAFPVANTSGVIGVAEFFSAAIEEPDPQLLAMMETLGKLLGQFMERSQVECTLDSLIDGVPDALLIVDTDGLIVRANVQIEGLFGYSPAELIGQPVEILLPRALRDPHRAHVQRYFAHPQVRRMGSGLDLFGRRKDGSELPVEIALSPLQIGQGVLACAAIRDVTERRQTEVMLQENRRVLSEAQQLAHVGSWSWDVEADQVEWSDELFRLYGQTREAWVPSLQGFLGLVHPDDRAEVQRIVQEALASGQPFEYQHRILRPDGEVRVMHARGRTILDQAGRAVRMLGTGQDITEMKQAQSRLEELARFDPLTTLPNRRYFLECLHTTLEQAKTQGWQVAVLFMDLDGFKGVNDSLGHAVGDELLREVTARLLRSLRARDIIGRLGGDEFAVILIGPPDADTAGVVAAKLNQALRRPFMVGRREIRVSASIGITLYPDDAQDVDTLLRFADTAMYAAKHSGKDAYRYYTADLNIRAQRKLELETALYKALGRREFFLEYQPKIDLRDGSWTGVEALMRWNHPQRGRVSPAEFIPALEDTGLIVAVGEWLIEAVCAQVGEWQRSGMFPLGVAINISAKQLKRRREGDAEVAAIPDNRCGSDELCLCLQQAMRYHRIPPGLLELELTESVLVEHDEQVVGMLDRLKSLGVRMTVDDFGTGYSSLAYLKRFPIDAFKIDGSFVRDAATDPDDAAITSTIIRMAHSMGMQAIAECVETREQLDFLRVQGCDQAQGYYFSRPLPADAVVREYQASLQHRPPGGEGH